MHTSRRSFLRSTAAIGLTSLAMPALAQSLPASSLGEVQINAEAMEQLHALVVIQGGEERLAIAPRGPGLDRIANIKSVSKTIVALLTGIAIDRGHLSGPNARVLPLLDRAETGDARDSLTVGNLLSMQTGLATTSGANYGAWVSSNDWVDYVLDAPAESRPGAFIYSTGGWHVLGALLARVTGRDLHNLARNWLGDPLGVEIPRWYRDPQGLYLGGNQMGLTPRSLARIGEMVRRGGLWNDTQVVPANWIEMSWQPRARSPWSGDQYGYGWFLTQIAGQEAAYGRGYGG